MTTGQTNATDPSSGQPVCDGSNDPSACSGDHWQTATGNFRLVGMVQIPLGAGTIVDGELLIVELSGQMGPDDTDAAARRILTRTADALVEEIRGSVNYYLTQAGEHALERLVVSGNGARLPHLANRVGRALGTRIEPVRVLEHVKVGRIRMTEAQLLEHQPVLPASIGLALWGSYVVPPTNRFAHVA